MTFHSQEELETIGFKAVGENVLISTKASIYNPGEIVIGNNVRIDDFCVLSAGQRGIVIKNHVHVAVYSSLIGQGKITLDSFSNLSSRVSIYSSNDDYSGASLTNPTIPNDYKDLTVDDVYIGKHAIVGCGSVILPGVSLHKGAALGALSLVKEDCEEFTIYSGCPARAIKSRKRNLERLEYEFRKKQNLKNKVSA